jgi:small-conductance mechanosensitive channel
MFGFLAKKAFFDMWDNMFRILIMNLGFIVILAGFILLAPLFVSIPALFIATIIVGCALFAMYSGGVSKMCAEIADYRQPGFADFFRFIKESFPSSLLFALAIAIYCLVVSVAFRFYGGMKSIAGPLAVALLFWVTVVGILAVQFFFPIQSRLDKKFRKIARKCFLVFFDNPGFSIGLSICAVIILAVSMFIALLLPGLAAILLWWNVAFKLRLYKYDWLEQNPEHNRRRVPWDALLVEDRERVGKRTLRGMIFPWRE